jgi:YVTN family beta-propeller protein
VEAELRLRCDETVGTLPEGVAVTPDGSKVYVTNEISNTVSVISTATNTVTATIRVGSGPFGVAVSPDGSKVYVANLGSGTVLVIAAATNTVIATIPVGSSPSGVSVTPDGSKVYVANLGDTVSVIAAATNTVIATIPVGDYPIAFGVFIQPAPRFAGTPGYSNCHGQSVSALARQFKGLNGAAAALGFSSVDALQNAILAFCGG